MIKDSQKYQDENQEAPQSGNIWGWKFSMISLVFIVCIILLMWYRHVSLGVPFIPSEIHTEESIKEKDQ